MKKIVLLLALSLLLATAMSLSAAAVIPSKHEEVVDIVNTKYKNLFVFKAERKLIGARVEVYSMNGDLVTAQRLHRRKMIIDFCDVKFGEYTIRITKGNEKQEFHYVKK
ncbi:MAG: hypothetical protein HRU69_02820 [Flammeovirgaceae bacterium]|nr:MAG: hypothetical protein HRU69_02820 [Flammeovirgaceae bacterium]